MRKIVMLVVVAALAGSSLVVAAEMDTQMTLAVVQAQRKELVQAAVQPAPQQEKAFWDTYWAYREDIANLNNRSIKLVEEYTASYAALDDAQSERMIKEATAIDVARVEARQKCVKKLQTILIPKQVVRFLQVEAKMDALVALEAAIAIPFTR